jgi:antitoxin CptB
MLETELIFRSFNKKYLHTLTLRQLQQYHALLQRDEPDIWNWLSGRAPVPDEVNDDIFRMIKAHMNDWRNFIKELPSI